MAKPNGTHAISRDKVARLLNPKSVAIIGVSERENTAGRAVLRNFDDLGYDGEIHLVSRNASEIGGRACLKDVSELPKGVDCAVLTVPGAAIEDTVKQLAEREVASIMCFASGFAELGTDGQSAQDRIAAFCFDNDIAFSGPNCLGFTNTNDNIAITFSASKILKDDSALKMGIVVQSGGMAAVFRTSAAAEKLSFTYSISTGNEAVVGVEDFLPFLIDDPETRVVVMLMEQIRKPTAFLEQAAAARAIGKPMILLHLGRSDAAKESAKTHTGALAGDYAVMEAHVRAAGVILVDGLDELIDTATVLTHYPNPPTGGVGVVTESGAFKGFALDFCEQIGLPMAEMQPHTRDAVADAIPDFVEATNPVDLTAQAIFDTEMYEKTMKALLADPGVGGVMVAMMVGTPELGLVKSGYVLDGKANSDKPVLCGFMGGDQPIAPEMKPKLTAAGVPFFNSPERGLRALGRALKYGETLITEAPSDTEISPGAGIDAAALPHGGTIPEYEAKNFLTVAGFDVPAGRLAQTLDEAQSIATEIGYPVVLKAQAADLTHKSDIGGVAVGIADEAALAAVWNDMNADVSAAQPELSLDGILVEAMGKSGVEMVLGAHRDAAWGPTLMIGLGGIFAEALKDVRFIPAKAGRAAITEAILSLRGATLLQGFRGAPPSDIDALADAVARLGALMLATPQLTEVDINPLTVLPAGDGVIALDALLVAE